MIVYKTTNLVNGKIYVGQALRPRTTYLGSGKNLGAAIIKYGRSNFKRETLQECSDRNELNDAEIFWIKELDSRNPEVGYNIHAGGNNLTYSTRSYTSAKKTIENWSDEKRNLNSKYKSDNAKLQKEKERLRRILEREEEIKQDKEFIKTLTEDQIFEAKHRIHLSRTNTTIFCKINRMFYDNFKYAAIAHNNYPDIASIVCQKTIKNRLMYWTKNDTSMILLTSEVLPVVTKEDLHRFYIIKRDIKRQQRLDRIAKAA